MFCIKTINRLKSNVIINVVRIREKTNVTEKIVNYHVSLPWDQQITANDKTIEAI